MVASRCHIYDSGVYFFLKKFIFNLNSSPEAYTASVEGVCWTEAGPAGAAEAIGES